MRIARIKILVEVDSQRRWEKAWRGKADLKRCFMSLERNIGRGSSFGYEERVNTSVVSWTDD